jgi:hypothetical protein
MREIRPAGKGDQMPGTITRSIETAIDDGETAEEMIAKVTAGTTITAVITGTSHGWPVANYSGSPEELVSMIRAHFSVSDDEKTMTQHLTAYGLFVLPEVVIACDEASNTDDDVLATQLMFEGAEKWLLETAKDPRWLVMKMLVVSGRCATEEEAHHLLFG